MNRGQVGESVGKGGVECRNQALSSYLILAFFAVAILPVFAHGCHRKDHHEEDSLVVPVDINGTSSVERSE